MTTSERPASRTASWVAAYRARASARPEPLCRDPWAAALAGPDGEALAAGMEATTPHMELWIAVRTALLDAEVERWTGPAQGLRQVVLLGAGFDTRAARLARPGVRWFEVDHPGSQRAKRERLAALPGYPLEAATFVTCDFEHEDFVDRLVACGFDAGAPALVLWEGVVPYLTEPAVRATLRRVTTALHPRTALVFDHLMKRFVESAELPGKDVATRDFVKDLGEQLRFGTNDPVPMLFEEGFRHVRSVSFDEACLTLTGTYLRAREFRFSRVVLASRTPDRTAI